MGINNSYCGYSVVKLVVELIDKGEIDE